MNDPYKYKIQGSPLTFKPIDKLMIIWLIWSTILASSFIVAANTGSSFFSISLKIFSDDNACNFPVYTTNLLFYAKWPYKEPVGMLLIDAVSVINRPTWRAEWSILNQHTVALDVHKGWWSITLVWGGVNTICFMGSVQDVSKFTKIGCI